MSDREYGQYGQCEATAKSTGERCRKDATGQHGKCNIHGGKSKKGNDHPNFKHGAFSKYFESTLSEREQEALDDLVDGLTADDEEEVKRLIAQIAGKALLKAERSNNTQFLREFRQLLSEFNVVDATDHVEVEGAMTQTVEHELTDEQRSQLDELTGGGISEE